jgi:hypothetical protein
MTYDDDYAFRSISPRPIPYASVHLQNRARKPITAFRTRFHASKTVGVLSLAASDISCSLPVRWELDASLGRPAQN